LGIGDKVGDTEPRAPEWELLVYTPAVFVRVVSKGLTGYGTWKSIWKMEAALFALLVSRQLE
jgi:hypothetical protein